MRTHCRILKYEFKNSAPPQRLNFLSAFALSLTLACLCSVGLLGCGATQPGLEQVPIDGTILAFGDSLTKGTGGHGASYPDELSRLSKRKVINAGVPGELSKDGLSRLPHVLETTRPRLMVLCHGGNDMLRKLNLDQASSNIRKMIELARANNVDVVLIGVPKPGLLLGTAKFYNEIAQQLSVPLEANILADVLSSPSEKADAVHPNDQGYRRMAQAIYELLVDAGAL